MSVQLEGTGATISDDTQLESLREGIDDPVVLREQLRKEADARRQLTARAKNAEAQAKEAREALVRAEEASRKQPTPTTNTPTTTEDERLEMRLDGYTKEEVNFIMANGGRSVLEDKNNYATIAIEARRTQLKAEQAASQTGRSSGEAQLQEANFRLPSNPSQKDLKASLEAMEKALPHAD